MITGKADGEIDGKPDKFGETVVVLVLKGAAVFFEKVDPFFLPFDFGFDVGVVLGRNDGTIVGTEVLGA